VRVAVLGTGRMGAYRAKWLGGRPGVEAVLVGSRDPARAHAVADAAGGTAGSYEEVLGEGPDAVVISTATPDHPPLIAECARLCVAAAG
jgi:myo-inositol 2-dehydrogenase/D-chiro-inositol 1-dehydrogenase